MDTVPEREMPLDIDEVEQWGKIVDGNAQLQAIIDAVTNHADTMYVLPVEYPPAVRLALTMQVVRIWQRRPEGAEAPTADDCALPSNTTSVTRQGVSIQIADPTAIVGRIEFDADTEVLLGPYRRFNAA